MPTDVNVIEKVARAEAERRYASPAHYGRAEIQAFIAGALWHRARGADFGPAPVVPDSPRWCRTCQGYGDHHTDGHPPEAVPDSPDVYETIRAFIEEEVGFDGGPGMDDQARRLTDRVLAVVGQGVTAEVEGEECAPDCDERAACDKTGLGHSMCGRCEHGEPRHHGEHFRCAVVRSGEKEG